MSRPKRLEQQAGRYSLVDGIPFQLPVRSKHTPGLMAAFSIDADKAAALLPGNELHPFRLWNRGLLIITVIDYRDTNIGQYIEYSIAIACTHGSKPAPRLLPGLLMGRYGTGQYVYDLPVSTEVSTKGGKGIWGMPKHQANLDFLIGEDTVSSQYDLDGQLAMRIDIQKPKRAWLPVSAGGSNYCAFRGLLMKSYVYFKGKMGFHFMKPGAATLTLGTHPRVQALKTLDINSTPLFAAYFPETEGVLDDHFESWFITDATPPTQPMEGMESVMHMGLGEDWLPPPDRTRPD